MEQNVEDNMGRILANEVVDRHSYFQLKYFVLGKEPTTQAMLWRCVRELQARKETIEATKREIEETNDRIALLDIDIEEAPNTSAFGVDDPAFEKRREIEVRRMRRQQESLRSSAEALQKKLKFTEEEAQFFVNAFISLERAEKLKAFDDPESQKAYWNEKLSQELSLRGLLRQPIDVELARTVFAVDLPVKEETVKMFQALEAQHQRAAKKVEEKSGADQTKQLG
jgi:hypothetical protein